MIFVLAAIAVTVSGLGLLRSLRVASGHAAVDVPLAWLVGSAWVGLASFSARALLGLAPGLVPSIVILALPLAAWGVVARTGRRAAHGAPPYAAAPRWMPRPAWLFVPVAAWVVAATLAVVLHGLNTPVHTDDAYRVRALAPVLAAGGAWNAEVRSTLVMAGPIPSFVPALPSMLGAPFDPVSLGASIVLTFVALLVLLVGLGSSRGFPEAGWGAAFAIASMPFFDYHAASSYADAWLGMFLAAAFAFLAAYGRERRPEDAVRAALLLVGAALVKREGELVVLPVAGILVLELLVGGRASRGALLRSGAVLASYLVAVAAKVAAVSLGGAFPFLAAAARRTTEGPATSAVDAAAAAQASGVPGAVAIFVDALFVAGNLGILWWVVAASVALLAPRLWRGGLGWAFGALALVLAETAASAIWLYPEFTYNQGTVHRSLLPVSAAAAVLVALLLAVASERDEAAAPAPVTAAPKARAPRSARRSRREGAARS